MQIKSYIKRDFLSKKNDVTVLIDTLAENNSPLWPSQWWPRDTFDSHLKSYAIGGHGGTRYIVSHYEPGHYVELKFILPKSYQGYHAFRLNRLNNNRWRIEHTTDIKTTRYRWLYWKILINPVHLALINNAFDCAEAYATDRPVKKSRWPWCVYFIRYLLGGIRCLLDFFSHFKFKRKSHHEID